MCMFSHGRAGRTTAPYAAQGFLLGVLCGAHVRVRAAPHGSMRGLGRSCRGVACPSMRTCLSELGVSSSASRGSSTPLRGFAQRHAFGGGGPLLCSDKSSRRQRAWRRACFLHSWLPGQPAAMLARHTAVRVQTAIYPPIQGADTCVTWVVQGVQALISLSRARPREGLRRWAEGRAQVASCMSACGMNKGGQPCMA